ncbi:hypothetical protein BTA51_13985 [Hahella sp. CCB-MM4]|uniref:AAA family ATPase n=1 Tax=Hahella sp. (strain CCB-MM4) TaxID=1926491 RepID=UPI000BD9AFDF|nr:AAA family ATPase [Hahella sp. CCB-MM4]OZG72635.1 hypothetical protein BTA51_13985 [Hahella sp. CCB-MM4]
MELRQGLGLSQEQVADECQQRRLYVSVSSLKRAELQRPVLLRTAHNLARFYDVTVEELIVVEDCEHDEVISQKTSPPRPEPEIHETTTTRGKVLGLYIAGVVNEQCMARQMEARGVTVHYSSQSFHVLLMPVGSQNPKPTHHAINVIRDIARHHPEIVALIRPIPADIILQGKKAHFQPKLSMIERLGIERFAKQQAPGSVMIHGELYHASRLDFKLSYDSNPDYAPGPWHSLSDSSPWHSLSDYCPQELRTVGRDQELNFFGSLLTKLKDEGQGAWCNISGVAGIGKTHMALAFAGESARHGVKHVILRGPYDDPQHRLHPGAELVCRLIGMSSVTELKLHNLLIDLCIDGHWYPYIYHLFGFSFSDDYSRDWKVPSISPVLFRNSCLQALETLLLALLEQEEVAVVIEDIQRPDDAMRLTLEALADLTPYCPLLLVTTSYFDYISGFEHCDINTVRLFPLTQNQSRELAGVDNICSEEWFERSILRSQGHPLYLLDLLHHEHLEDELPFSIGNTMTAKTAHLPPRLKFALELISVSKDGFTHSQLEELMDGPLVRFASLLSQGILQPIGEHYFFSHNLYREAVYQSMPADVQQRRHGIAAEWFREKNPVQYAVHLAKSGSSEALPELLATAERLVYNQHYKQAKNLLLLAEPFLESSPLKCVAYRMHAWALKALGEIGKGIRFAQAAIEHCTDECEASRDWHLLAEMYYRQGKTEDALHALNCAEILAERYNQHDLGTELYKLHSEILLGKGQVVASQEYRNIASEMAKRTSTGSSNTTHDNNRTAFVVYGDRAANLSDFMVEPCIGK